MQRPEFVLAGEFETIIGSPQSRDVQWARSKGYRLLTSEAPPRVNDAALVRQAQSGARDMLKGLHPQSDQEAERLGRWKAQVVDFTPTDAVNFGIYEGFSSPTLTYKQSTLGMRRTSLINLHGGPLEFRFGKDLFQDGYYDNCGVSETRLAPRPQERYLPRRAWLMRRIGRIAEAHGLVAYLGTEHVNASCFAGELPLLNDPRENIGPYQAAAAGLRRLLFEGALYDPDSKSPTPTYLEISPWRDTTDVRVLPGHFELRTFHMPDRDQDKIYAVDQTRSIRFLLSGMEYGLRFASPEDLAHIKIVETLATKAGEGYIRTEDLCMQRFLGGLTVDGAGLLQPDNVFEKNGALGRFLYGRTEYVAASNAKSFAQTLQLEGGHARINAEKFRRLVEEYPSIYTKSIWAEVNPEEINSQLGRISVEPVKSVVWQGKSPKLDDNRLLEILGQPTGLEQVDPGKYAELLAHAKTRAPVVFGRLASQAALMIQASITRIAAENNAKR